MVEGHVSARACRFDSCFGHLLFFTQNNYDVKNLFSLFLFLILILAACKNSSTGLPDTTANPPAEGFNQVGSDPKAIEIADSIMKAMGGRKAWDDTRIIAWNFFGRRHLIWNKATGDVRIDVPQDTAVYLLNIKDGTARVQRKGMEITDPDSLVVYSKKGEGMWINDSYWLVMPFKLKDSGVTLGYMGQDTTQSGIPSHVLQLTFDEVGNTPDNMYKVWVDQSDHLVKQWAYYARYDQEQPPAIWPWDNYQTYGQIKLSADRSDGRGPKMVQVYESLPGEVFNSFAATEFARF